MKLSELFEVLESLEFTAEFAVISGAKIFNFALANNANIQGLVSILRTYPEAIGKIYERIQELLNVDRDSKYRHPYDISIAIYLHALNIVNKDLSRAAAQRVSNTPRMRWSYEIAQRIRSEQPKIVVSYIQQPVHIHIYHVSISTSNSEDVILHNPVNSKHVAVIDKHAVALTYSKTNSGEKPLTIPVA